MRVLLLVVARLPQKLKLTFLDIWFKPTNGVKKAVDFRLLNLIINRVNHKYKFLLRYFFPFLKIYGLTFNYRPIFSFEY